MTQLTDYVAQLLGQLQPVLITAAEIDALQASTSDPTALAQQVETFIGELDVLAPASQVTYTNGMSAPDDRGLVKLQTIENWRATDSKAANVHAYWAIQDILSEPMDFILAQRY